MKLFWLAAELLTHDVNAISIISNVDFQKWLDLKCN